MEIKDLDSWLKFETVVQQNNNETDELKNNENMVSAVAAPIYRGQANSNWDLSSTLERKVKKDFTVGSYLNLILKVWNDLNYKQKWPNLKTEIEELDADNLLLFQTQKANTEQIISFMTHLRHHGFPSPLLDWTSDPLIAAFFAFENIPDNAKRVAIYSFREYTGYPADCRKTSEPTLIEIGSYIPGIERHANQKSHYILCTQQDDGKTFKDARFAKPEEDINRNGFYLDEKGNDIDKNCVEHIMKKFTIPVSERKFVIKKLQTLNINRSSLFDSTEDNQLYDFWNIMLNDEEIDI